MKKPIYLIVSVKDGLPEESGKYFFLFQNGEGVYFPFDKENPEWYRRTFTHYLKLSEANVFSDEELDEHDLDVIWKFKDENK